MGLQDMPNLKQPPWLKKTIYRNTNMDFTKAILSGFNINTVCQSANCPNIFDCFSSRTATFLILGKVCCRNCGFCAVTKGRPQAVDESEPDNISEAAFILGLKHIVITSVTRDDLSDGGAQQFVRAIQSLRQKFKKDASIEILIPDFKGKERDIKQVVDARPDIFGHNVEMAPGLYKTLRPEADYARSINVLKLAKKFAPQLTTKSAIMVGLGESEGEVISVMEDLRAAGCDMLAIGQYLRPSLKQVAVRDFISPEKFSMFKKIGDSMGFKEVQSGPFVRSSYRAGPRGGTGNG